jgi:hypothetical protein
MSVRIGTAAGCDRVTHLDDERNDTKPAQRPPAPGGDHQHRLAAASAAVARTVSLERIGNNAEKLATSAIRLKIELERPEFAGVRKAMKEAGADVAFILIDLGKAGYGAMKLLKGDPLEAGDKIFGAVTDLVKDAKSLERDLAAIRTEWKKVPLAARRDAERLVSDIATAASELKRDYDVIFNGAKK